MRENGIVPLPMKRVSPDTDGSHLLIRDRDSCWISTGIQRTAHAESFLVGCSRDELKNDFVTHQRFSSPVLADEGKETMLDFVPFARSRRQVRNRDGESCFVSQFLQF